MRFLLQRVKEAEVLVDSKSVAKINQGILALVGIKEEDKNLQESHLKKLVEKILFLRIFSDKQNKLNLSLMDIKGELLLVSQFTLYADTRKGRRPSFSRSLAGEEAKILFDRLVELSKSVYPKIKTGIFGAEMEIKLINHGPVTIFIDSDDLL